MPGSTSSGELLAIARRVRGQAVELRLVAVQITIVAARTRWQSRAAGTFRDRVRELALAMRAGAAKLDDAAGALERHAAHVDSR